MKLTDEIIETNGFEFSEFPNPEFTDIHDNVIIWEEHGYSILNETQGNSWTFIETEEDLLNYMNK